MEKLTKQSKGLATVIPKCSVISATPYSRPSKQLADWTRNSPVRLSPLSNESMVAGGKGARRLPRRLE